MASELRLKDLVVSHVTEMPFNPVTGAPINDPKRPMPNLDIHRRNVQRIELGLEALIQTGTDDEWNRVMPSISVSVSALGSWGSVEDLDLCIGFLNYLSGLFHRRFLLLRRREDLEESLSMYEASSKSHRPGDAWRSGDLDLWAQLARGTNHPSAPRAYENSMLSMRHIVECGPNLQAQHAYFKHGGAWGTRTSLDYASYQIEKEQLQAAVEILEHGRSLLWSMMRGLRAPVGQLRAVNPDLADKYLSITHDLESITTESSALHRAPSSAAGSFGDTVRSFEEDTFGRVFEEQRRLLRERKAVISQIQSLPGFGHFLAAAPFHSLQNAASSGPIVIINHSKWRSDILIIVYGAPLVHIPLGDDFYVKAIALSRLLSKARNSEGGLDSDELDVLGVPKQSRLWLYPTSVLCSLPLHAMGPSHRALIESRTPAAGRSRQRSPDPSLLVVAQPDDPSLEGVSKEIATIESVPGISVSKLVSRGATRESVIEGLKGHSMVHFACHGLLQEEKPFDASFKLHGSERLTLLDIIRSRAPNAELAFLSACHTAELADKEDPDEMLHLAAAMQYCGFRSVVGTMWELADTDGKDMAKLFYGRLLSPRWDASVPIAERSAKALQHAVQNLRKKRRMTTERWVNFVHYGA
ncbi:CHAT domain-containing protein [Gloeopeniophorella convolvens]|nr:CHAT domain-containing protein [Gloeopeniophorella convolvens]